MNLLSRNHHRQYSAWGKVLAAGLLLNVLSPVLSQDTTILERHPVMHFSPEEKRRLMLEHLSAPQLTAGRELGRAWTGSMSLLSRLPYVPAERNQRSCGDCWQWAGTGVMEIAHDVQDGVHDRLSIQFINSCQRAHNCCDGGWLYDVANFYSWQGFAVPWTNANAQFTSGNGTCSSAPCGTIGTQPNYPITSIAYSAITTHGVSQDQAISNIKSVLNQNKAVFFAFYLPDDAAWLQFDTFWSSQAEAAAWTNFFCGQAYDPYSGAGHAVLCVGYNDDDPADRYWIIVNSWGTTGKRPTGLFHLGMDLDYSCQDGSGSYNLYFQTLNMQYTPIVPPSPPAITNQPQSQTVSVKSDVVFSVGATGTEPLQYQWRKNGTAIPDATSTSYSLTNVATSASGVYSVVVNNSYGSATSSNAILTVFIPTVPLPYALNNSNLTWTINTNSSWYGQTNISHDGAASAQTGALGDGQQARLSTTVAGPGTLTFWWKVSSQADADVLSFLSYGNGLTNRLQISGESDWQPQSFLLSGGLQTLQWTYAKDAWLAEGLDAAWVDQVSYVAGPTLPTLLTQPLGQTCPDGTPWTFMVTATGTPPLTYQWRLNGTNIPGATGASLSLPAVHTCDGGAYSVSVANGYGLVVSSNAWLQVVFLGAWGDDWFGQADLPASASNAIAVAAGAWHSLALKANGTVVAWGHNYDCQCDIPAQARNVMAIAAGGYHSLALKLDGTVAGWGANGNGQATPPAGLSNVTAVAAGAWHSLALRADGSVVAWGDNSFGQCSLPAGLANVIAIAAGGNHSLALRRNGSVAAWGENMNDEGLYAGQSAVPANLTNVVAIGAGDYHSLAVKADGSVVLWGDNSAGQCQAQMCQTGIVAVVGGAAHTIALKQDGTIAAWGADWSGQCDFPIGLTNVVAIAAGNSHTLLLVGDATRQPQLLHATRTGSRFSSVVQTFSGRAYALEYKNSLSDANWTPYPTVRGNGALQFLTDPGATAPQRFYRVREW